MRSGRERAQRNLYVLNLPLDATTDQLEALFAQFGQVEHAVILATLDHLARRRGFILMSDSTQARAAIANLNGHDWHGYRVEVSFAIVQRSATPFSQECVESHGDEVAAQPKAVDTVVQVSLASHQRTREGGCRFSISPHKFESTILTDQHLLRLNCCQTKPEQCQGLPLPEILPGGDESALLLSGLDASVVTSPAMVRALTEPFGHVVELQHLEQRDGRTYGDRALVRYCCASSASLARLSLHGLLIGAMQVQASVSRLSPSIQQPVPGSFQDDLSSSVPARDQLTADSRAGSAPPSVRSNIVSQAHSTPRPSQIPTGHVALSPARIGTDHGGASHHSLWSENGATVAAASKQDSEDSDHGPRRNVPRPIGDERQRATGKKWK
uniref:RRM domain-containing protein n=1 Tax=Kalmanozyma brasiliensis (strain GHG001) TaxID=1365824 RepID=V5F313_KALBG